MQTICTSLCQFFHPPGISPVEKNNDHNYGLFAVHCACGTPRWHLGVSSSASSWFRCESPSRRSAAQESGEEVFRRKEAEVQGSRCDLSRTFRRWFCYTYFRLRLLRNFSAVRFRFPVCDCYRQISGVRCVACLKVLSVDVVNSKLLLTHKKSLVNSKMASVTAYSDLRPGATVEGCVVSIKPAGLVIAFYSSVKVSIQCGGVALKK